MKRGAIIFWAVLGVAVIAAMIYVHTASAEAPATCSEGSYLIGYAKDDSRVPVCKTNPTGCPYGDSVPMGPECDKLTPVDKNTSVVVTPVVEPDYTTLPVMGGK